MSLLHSEFERATGTLEGVSNFRYASDLSLHIDV